VRDSGSEHGQPVPTVELRRKVNPPEIDDRPAAEVVPSNMRHKVCDIPGDVNDLWNAPPIRWWPTPQGDEQSRKSLFVADFFLRRNKICCTATGRCRRRGSSGWGRTGRRARLRAPSTQTVVFGI